MGDVLYRPADLGRLSGDEVGRFYANYLHEAVSVPFDAAERAYLDDPKVLGRIVDPATRLFFAYHVGAAVARVVRSIVAGRGCSTLVAARVRSRCCSRSAARV